MRILDWAIGTFAFYGVGIVLASFVAGEVIIPLSSATDRLLLIMSGLIAFGMMLDEDRRP